MLSKLRMGIKTIEFLEYQNVKIETLSGVYRSSSICLVCMHKYANCWCCQLSDSCSFVRSCRIAKNCNRPQCCLVGHSNILLPLLLIDLCPAPRKGSAPWNVVEGLPQSELFVQHGADVFVLVEFVQQVQNCRQRRVSRVVVKARDQNSVLGIR